MTYVITSVCDGVCDTACVQVCPVDCIGGPIPLDAIRTVPAASRKAVFGPGVRLFIDPELCIDCGACEPVCPVQAIVHEDDLPPGESPALEAAKRFFGR
jgi:ferredoxin